MTKYNQDEFRNFINNNMTPPLEFSTTDIFDNSILDNWKESIKEIMEYRSVCSKMINQKTPLIKERLRDYESINDETDFRGITTNNTLDEVPFYNNKIKGALNKAREIYAWFISYYGIKSVGLMGDFYTEFLNHINPLNNKIYDGGEGL